MARELVPYLEGAVERSPSELVFPRADGGMYTETTKLETVLRRSLRRAGIILGYRHKCRKSGCGFVEAATDDISRRCPTHGHLMWAGKPSVVRPIRFHDLRHPTGSLLTMQGANLAAVQKIMRHKDPRITSETYLHTSTRATCDERSTAHFGAPTETKERRLPRTLVSIVCLDPASGPSRESIRLALESMACQRTYDGAGEGIRTVVGIRKVDGAVGANRDVVGRVEALAHVLRRHDRRGRGVRRRRLPQAGFEPSL